MLASTLVTTLNSSEVHSNVASHGLLLQLDDAKAGMMVASVRVTNRFYVEVLRLSESVKLSKVTDRHPIELDIGQSITDSLD